MVSEILPKDAQKRIDRGDAVLLDVRHREEVEFTSVKPHTWIELSELAGRFSELPKEKQIICICRTGGRSSTAADFLTRKGYNAANLQGGIFEWSKIGSGLKKYVYSWAGEKLVVREIV